MSSATRAAFFALVALGLAAPGMVTATEAAGWRLAMAQGAAPTAGESRDELYRETLHVAERFKAVWKQQPGNRAALERYLAETRSKVDALCSMQAAAEQPVAPGARPRRAEVAEADVPSGPVQPSQEPSAEADVERRMEATLEQFHGVGLRGEVRPSLAGVEEEWIARQCEEARAQLSEVERALATAPRDDAALAQALAEMHEGLLRMASPPADSPPVLPTAPRADSG